ncbi:MAG: sigma-54 dependent transcriptional regulator [Acidobacteriota bacterium]
MSRPAPRGRILVVDDDRSMCELLDAALPRRGFVLEWRTSASDAFDLMTAEEFDVVVTDLNMKGMSGLELCERVVANRPDVLVVVITAFGSLESAVAAIRAGAYDYITKPFEIETLLITLDRAVGHRNLREEVKRLRRSMVGASGFDEILGSSPAMRKVYDLLDRVAETDASVLVTGESGTGKELAARAIHARSSRRSGPFVAVNCAAVPEALLESELFGHARGAFTDARAARPGLFASAAGGTLLLDEIGDLPLPLQPKLLRALQERKVRPVGADEEVPFDARIVSATNRDLETDVLERRFREDLFYRINVIHVDLPPLRARGGDVLILAQSFLERFAARFGKPVKAISTSAAEKLYSYSWPGNVRELENAMERAVALTRFEEIVVDDLPDKIRRYHGGHVLVASDDPTELIPLEELERRYILRALETLGGNKTLTAQRLGLDRKTLYRKLERYAEMGSPPAEER